MVNFIVNENSKSGKGALVWQDVKAYLDENGLEYSAWFTRHKGHARELAAMLSENEDKCDIIALGGDGTLNEIINGIKDFSKVRVGLIPSGSGNDFARGLGIADKPVELLKKLIASTEDDLIDIGQLNYCNENGYQSRYFIVSAGGGIDAYVCKKNDELKVKAILNKFHLGKLSYFVITLMSLLAMECPDTFVRYDDGELEHYKGLIFNSAMNFRTEGGGVPMAPDADPRDGYIGNCFIHSIPRICTFFYLPWLVTGKHGKFKNIDIKKIKKISLAHKAPLHVHTDGEYLGLSSETSFECSGLKARVIKV